NSPAMIGSELPRIRARSMKPSAESMIPSSSSLAATALTDDPLGTMNARSSSRFAEPHQPAANHPSAAARTSSSAATRVQPLRTKGFLVDLLHHQRGVGPAEAEGVVEHRAHFAALGLVRHEVDARAALARVVEVERRRDHLVAQG